MKKLKLLIIPAIVVLSFLESQKIFCIDNTEHQKQEEIVIHTQAEQEEAKQWGYCHHTSDGIHSIIRSQQNWPLPHELIECGRCNRIALLKEEDRIAGRMTKELQHPNVAGCGYWCGSLCTLL